jgi:hypothetical protein
MLKAVLQEKPHMLYTVGFQFFWSWLKRPSKIAENCPSQLGSFIGEVKACLEELVDISRQSRGRVRWLMRRMKISQCWSWLEKSNELDVFHDISMSESKSYVGTAPKGKTDFLEVHG